ncbi:MAG: DUF460 domain-containing protein [Candidatus Micrarchaeota archaeon]
MNNEGELIYIIVGVDAGTNVGYAVLDLNGKLIASGAEREVGEERMVEKIRKIGIPSLIATDVSPAPYFARKIGARFNVKVFEPNKSMMVKEKRKIGKNAKVDDPHVRDAYSAAIKAHRFYANRLRQIESTDRIDTEEKDRMKHLVITGTAIGKKENDPAKRI